MAAPEVVATVQHLGADEKGRKPGHHGYLQRRQPEKVSKFGGHPFASWAVRTVDGQDVGTVERFETYDTEAEAVAHAKYAASQPTSSDDRTVRHRARRTPQRRR